MIPDRAGDLGGVHEDLGGLHEDLGGVQDDRAEPPLRRAGPRASGEGAGWRATREPPGDGHAEEAGAAETGPRFRAPHSSLAVGRRFRLLARGPLIGAGRTPRVPKGFWAAGRGAPRPATASATPPAPESPYEKQPLLPLASNRLSRDVAWAEGRFAADVAVEHSLLVSMMLPTEMAPERKKEAQRLHERALKLFQRIEALGPSGVGDPRGFAEDLESGLRPLLDFEAACAAAQVRGELWSLAWPSLHIHLHGVLRSHLDRLGAIAAGEVDERPHAAAGRACALLAVQLRLTSAMLDPVGTGEREWVLAAQGLAQRLDGLAGPVSEPQASLPALQDTLDFHTDLVRAVEQGRVMAAMAPFVADGFRRQALKAIDDLSRSIAAAR